MRELAQDEYSQVGGGHGFADGGIVNAILAGAGVGGIAGGPVGAYVGGIAGGVAYLLLTSGNGSGGLNGRNDPAKNAWRKNR